MLHISIAMFYIFDLTTPTLIAHSIFSGHPHNHPVSTWNAAVPPLSLMIILSPPLCLSLAWPDHSSRSVISVTHSTLALLPSHGPTPSMSSSKQVTPASSSLHLIGLNPSLYLSLATETLCNTYILTFRSQSPLCIDTVDAKMQ